MSKIKALAEKYCKNNVLGIKELSKIYLLQQKTFLETLAVSASFYGIFLTDKIDYDSITPQMEEAFNLSYPNMNLNDLENYSTDQLTGLISNWKGKYFEVVVRDKLNNGEMIGDLQLESGQYAKLAESATQPGWDLQIFDENDVILNELQLKATNSLNYINSALERYPDIEIISTSEVAEQKLELINSSIKNSEIAEPIEYLLEPINDTVFENFFENALPFTSFIVIATIQGRKYISGKSTIKEASNSFLIKSIQSGVAISSGALALAIFDSGLISIGTTMLTKVFIKGRNNKIKIIQSLDNHKKYIENFKTQYYST